jgi:GNAT superfamily N-acetyltransferase
MKLHVQLAQTAGELRECRKLLEDVYGRDYGVRFTEGDHHPDLCVEPYPDAFVMGLAGDELAVIGGLYLRNTYAERFGGMNWSALEPALRARGLPHREADCVLREYTRLAVRPEYRGAGLGRRCCALTHSREFIAQQTDKHVLLFISAKRSIFREVHAKSRMETHYLKDFPVYLAHRKYAESHDPIEIRYMVADLDIPPELLSARLGRDHCFETDLPYREHPHELHDRNPSVPTGR